ncbi:MAG: redox-sensitive transcriptional activator SoxR [Actinomycetota bacterium]|nr:redox-sensitive transcriptional activator SoxR [Actinomycetota bacterium]
MASSQSLTVSEVARRSGFAPSALRFYEQRGLIEATRTGGGQRRYQRIVLRRLAFIRAASNVGLSLDEIAAELRMLPRSRTPTAADWQRISRDWRVRLDERIGAIQALRDRLDGCIGCGCLSLRSCALYNPDDEIGTRMSGAGRLPELLRRPTPPRGVPEAVGRSG